MEALLKSSEASHLADSLADLGVESRELHRPWTQCHLRKYLLTRKRFHLGPTVDDMALCNPGDLVADLKVDEDLAKKLVDGAKEAQLFEKRKTAIQSTWKTVGDSLGVEATKLFYKRLFEQYPDVVPMFGDANMDEQAEKLLKTVSEWHNLPICFDTTTAACARFAKAFADRSGCRIPERRPCVDTYT